MGVGCEASVIIPKVAKLASIVIIMIVVTVVIVIVKIVAAIIAIIVVRSMDFMNIDRFTITSWKPSLVPEVFGTRKSATECGTKKSATFKR